MSIALDVGAHTLRTLRRQGRRLIGRRNLASYLAIPDRPGRRRLLEASSFRYATCEGHLLVIGRAALELAETLEMPCIPLLVNGRLPMDDPLARQVTASLVDSLLPQPERAAATCCLSVPEPGDNHAQTAFFCQLVRLKGYTPRILDAGTAIVLSEGAADRFTGIGLSFGAGATSVAVVHRGVPRIAFTLPHGGNWIDTKLAENEDCLLWDTEGNRYLNLRSVAAWKESSLVSVSEPISEREQRLSLLYEELLQDVLSLLKRHLADSALSAALPPLPVVCAGGVTRVNGFIDLLQQAIHEFQLPVTITEVQHAADSEYTVARGCLIQAEVDGSPRKPAELPRVA